MAQPGVDRAENSHRFDPPRTSRVFQMTGDETVAQVIVDPGADHEVVLLSAYFMTETTSRNIGELYFGTTANMGASALDERAWRVFTQENQNAANNGFMNYDGGRNGGLTKELKCRMTADVGGAAPAWTISYYLRKLQ